MWKIIIIGDIITNYNMYDQNIQRSKTAWVLSEWE